MSDITKVCCELKSLISPVCNTAEAKSIRISLKLIVSGFVIPCLLHYSFPPISGFFKQCLQRSVYFTLVSTLRSYACVY